MDQIQKTLIEAGREDLAKEYIEKMGAGIEGAEKASFDFIDTVVDMASAPVGDRAFKIVIKTYNTKADGTVEYLCNYPDDVNLGKMKNYRLKVKKEMFDGVLAIASKFDTDFQKIMKEYNLIRIKN